MFHGIYARQQRRVAAGLRRTLAVVETSEAPVSSADVAGRLNIPQRTAVRYLKRLLDDGLLNRKVERFSLPKAGCACTYEMAKGR